VPRTGPLIDWGISYGRVCLGAHVRLPPHPRTRLIGREGERAAARAFLLEGAVPFLMLTGQGTSARPVWASR